MLNPDGINKLEAIMLANGKYFYSQSTFGEHTSCGTSLCAAGFAHLLKIGPEQFEEELTETERRDPDLPYDEVLDRKYVQDCVQDGIELLGLTHPGVNESGSGLPQIFNFASEWPDDIYETWRDTEGPMDKIRIYVNMLRTRVNDDGSIRPE